ncbi:MAG: dihydroorotase family protein [bacterium]|nr:dihydroorotase family protein [bacterium]
MSDSKPFDKLIRNVRLVRPKESEVPTVDVAVRDGKFAAVGHDLPAGSAKEVLDAGGLLGFPGLVDAHMHVGIYQPLADDAPSESKAAAMGGVTSSLNYMRTGQYYLNRGGPYREFFPEVLEISGGRFHVDYAYHLAPISSGHIDELDMLLDEFGVASFKIFMFYGGYGLHGRSSSQNDFLMIDEDESYDFAHFEFVMRGVRRLMQAHPEIAEHISLSLHCELAEIMSAYTRIVESEGKLTGLRAYSAARPPHSEGLAIWIASYLAYETDCLNINLLHLSSRKALEAALMMEDVFPHIDFRREATVGHLLLDVDAPAGKYAKVNPPIRPRDDVEFLWEALLEGAIDWVVSDHACCSQELKASAADPDNIWLAKSGFGGTEYLLSGLHSEGRKRGLALNHMAELTSWNPARRYGLLAKGDVAPGYDADLVLFDPDDTFVVRAEESESSQGYTPFEGMELTGRVKTTLLRGEVIYENGEVVGPPRGRYLKRPYEGE